MSNKLHPAKSTEEQMKRSAALASRAAALLAVMVLALPACGVRDKPSGAPAEAPGLDAEARARAGARPSGAPLASAPSTHRASSDATKVRANAALAGVPLYF